MLKVNNKDIVDIYVTVEGVAKSIQKVYKASTVVWQKGSSVSTDLGKLRIFATPITDNKYHLGNGAVLGKTSGTYIESYNFEINGDLTNTNGILSNFSTSNYATIANTFSPENKPWELYVPFETSSPSPMYQAIFDGITDNTKSICLMVSDSKLLLNIDSSGNWIVDASGNTSIQANTKYWVKVIFTGTQYIAYLSTTGEFAGEETTEISVATTATVRQNSTFAIGYASRIDRIFYGKIYANEAYIKINNEYWWQGVNIGVIEAYPEFVEYMEELYNDSDSSLLVDFIQPILTQNGILGGNRFAVWANTEFYDGNYPAWRAFDNNSTTSWATNGNPNPSIIEFYNPDPLNVTLLTTENRGNSENITGGTVYASNDNSTWTKLTDFTNSNIEPYGIWTIDLSSNTDYYNYYKIECTSFTSGNAGFNQINITATYRGSLYFITEDNWQNEVATYGVCDKYVYNSIYNTVRLPKYGNSIQGELTAYYYIKVK